MPSVSASARASSHSVPTSRRGEPKTHGVSQSACIGSRKRRIHSSRKIWSGVGAGRGIHVGPWLKSRPSSPTAGTAGAGSGSHIAGVYFESVSGIKLQYVPYRGTAPALNDLIAGQIDVIVDQTSNSINQVRAGTIRAYAVTDDKRLPSAPDIPTAEEAGLKGFHMTLWSGMWVPKGTPKVIVAKLNAAAVDALNDPAVKKQLESQGLEMTPQDQLTPEALGTRQKAEIAKWWPIIKAANIKVD